nr:hypothetical protein [uncultured Agathobaculum sp.]
MPSFDNLSIETTLSIESEVSKSRAKLDFSMPLAERLNDCAAAQDDFRSTAAKYQ